MTNSCAPLSEAAQSQAEGFPSVAIMAVYFGALPPYFELWLDSCGYNPKFDWLLFTDAEVSGYAPPPNVHFRQLTLEGFSQRINAALGLQCRIGSAYKVCDFRPVFWVLLNGEPRAYDFWGHCDLDMIFGDLERFITNDLLARFDKIFSVGHLTLYRNCELANNMFSCPDPDNYWRAVLSDPNHRGFDEHIGVNRIWRAHRGRVFEDEGLIADIDPAIARFELVAPRRNYQRQLFYFDRGHVFRGYCRGAEWCEEEFMYIHFQKRAMGHLPNRGASRYAVSANGFYELPRGAPLEAIADDLNPNCLSLRESFHRWRCTLRHLRSISTLTYKAFQSFSAVRRSNDA